MTTENDTSSQPAVRVTEVASAGLFAGPWPSDESVYVATVTETKFMRNRFTNPHVGWGVFSRGREWHRTKKLADAQAWAEQHFSGIKSWSPITDTFRVADSANKPGDEPR